MYPLLVPLVKVLRELVREEPDRRDRIASRRAVQGRPAVRPRHAAGFGERLDEELEHALRVARRRDVPRGEPLPVPVPHGARIGRREELGRLDEVVRRGEVQRGETTGRPEADRAPGDCPYEVIDHLDRPVLLLQRHCQRHCQVQRGEVVLRRFQERRWLPLDQEFDHLPRRPLVGGVVHDVPSDFSAPLVRVRVDASGLCRPLPTQSESRTQ